MAIHKVIEVLSQSEKSWEDAAQRAVSDTAKTVRRIKSIYIKNMEGVVKNDKIVEYRVNANITFELEGLKGTGGGSGGCCDVRGRLGAFRGWRRPGTCRCGVTNSRAHWPAGALISAGQALQRESLRREMQNSVVPVKATKGLPDPCGDAYYGIAANHRPYGSNQRAVG